MRRWHSSTVNKSLFWSACFSFCLGKTIREVPYVNLPYLFIGEEFLMSMLYFTHGYHFYKPHKMIVRHKWSREGRPLFFDNYLNDHRKTQLKNLTYQKLKDIFDIPYPEQSAKVTYPDSIKNAKIPIT